MNARDGLTCSAQQVTESNVKTRVNPNASDEDEALGCSDEKCPDPEAPVQYQGHPKGHRGQLRPAYLGHLTRSARL